MDNRIFWNERYRSLPSLGSGPGSRAYAAWIKRRLLEATIAQHDVRSILDIGCGDMYWFPRHPHANVAYTGIDISEVVVEQNQAKLANAEFLVHDIAAQPLRRSADLVVCFDVLIHQLPIERFQSMLRNVLASVSKLALISYLSADGSSGTQVAESPGEIRREEEDLLQFLDTAVFPRAATAFHGDLGMELARLLPQASLRIAGSYPHQTIYELRV